MSGDAMLFVAPLLLSDLPSDTENSATTHAGPKLRGDHFFTSFAMFHLR